MLLVIDAGNTNTVFATFDAGDKLRGQWRMATDVKRTADEYAVWLLQLMQFEKLDPKKIKAVVMSSVVPQTNFNFRKLARQYFKCELIQVGAPGVIVGIEAKIDRPGEVGADRLVNRSWRHGDVIRNRSSSSISAPRPRSTWWTGREIISAA